MTDEERMQAFRACVDSKKTISPNGRNFVIDVLSGNFGGAVGDWIKEVREANENSGQNCFEILTPEQRQKIMDYLMDHPIGEHSHPQ